MFAVLLRTASGSANGSSEVEGEMDLETELSLAALGK
jgi:hypothetical protein